MNYILYNPFPYTTHLSFYFSLIMRNFILILISMYLFHRERR